MMALRWMTVAIAAVAALVLPTSAVLAQAPDQDLVYDRPFVVEEARAAVGGYAEANVGYAGQDGVDEGPSFEFRRFNLFVFSQIAPYLRFISELEFEHGTEEIALETALLDVELHHAAVLRAGILLTPLGAFNQNHDAPAWDFVERPLVSTTIIPATFSEVGGGVHGTFFAGPIDLDYQLYATQGLADGVIDNDLGRTAIAEGKAEELFEEDNNGSVAVTGRFAARFEDIAELGLSGWHGAYNTFELEGERVDERRTVSIAALDTNVTVPYLELRAELAYAWIDVPASLVSTFGEEQWGFHLDAISPVWAFDLAKNRAVLDVGLRFEYVDYNLGTLPSTGTDAGDEHTRLTGAVAFRPLADTVVRLNYGWEWITDLAGNEPAQGAALRFGFATYF